MKKRNKMSVVIKSENQLSRINELKTKLADLDKYTQDLLHKRANEKSWSVLEVIKHMEIGHMAYRAKVNKVLSTPKKEKAPADNIQSSSIPSFLIKRFPPKDKVIRFKMKTTTKFKPILNGKENPSKVIASLKHTLDELENWITNYKDGQISLEKFNSAIGPLVRFNVPEACEFILCHNERHMLQIENTLKKVSE